MELNLTNDFSGKELPFSLEAEQTVLGGILLEPSTLPVVMEYLKPESFYKEQHRELFAIFMRMFSNGQTADLITVLNESVALGIFETSAMAKTYLKGLMESIPSVANIESYCKIVEEKFYLRALINAANEIIRNATEGTVDATNLLDSAEQKIFDIRQGKASNGLARIDSVLIDTMSRLGQLSGENKEKYAGAKTGFSQLDNVTTGLNNSDLLVIGARPGMGKTAFAINIATNACKRNHKSVAIFNLEMGKEQLVSRMLSSESMVNSHSLRSGQIDQDDWVKLAQGADVLSKLPIYIDDTAGITVPQMKAKLRRMKNLGLVVVDYIQLMESPNKHSSRVNEVSEITRQLKLMAKELNVPVIALSQLARSSEKRDDKRPMLSDLRESGSIEQDADLILFLYRDAYYDRENTEKAAIAECIVAKNRHGETGTVKLAWIGEYTLFTNLDTTNRTE
ncbi:MAG: replicative DNA helicase [Ruminococcus sp.]|nr:replicative DNA helicase [Ruminococcus sp.]